MIKKIYFFKKPSLKKIMCEKNSKNLLIRKCFLKSLMDRYENRWIETQGCFQVFPDQINFKIPLEIFASTFKDFLPHLSPKEIWWACALSLWVIPPFKDWDDWDDPKNLFLFNNLCIFSPFSPFRQNNFVDLSQNDITPEQMDYLLLKHISWPYRFQSIIETLNRWLNILPDMKFTRIKTSIKGHTICWVNITFSHAEL